MRITGSVQNAVRERVRRSGGAAMRRLSGSLLVLTCAVVVLGVESILPRLVFAGEGVGGYTGEMRAFARFALVYDLYLKEWPFP